MSDTNSPDNMRVCAILEPHHEISRLLRVAKRKAKQKGCGWCILLVNTPALYKRFSRTECEAMEKAAQTAEGMGAQVIRINSKSMMAGIRGYIRDNPQIEVFVTADIRRKKSWFSNGRKSLDEKLKRYIASTPIITVPIGIEKGDGMRWTSFWHVRLEHIWISILAVVMATLCIELIDYFAPEAIGSHNRNKSIIYMIACAFAAGRYGLLSGIIASVASFLALNMLYIAPYYDLAIENRTNAINLGLFLSASIVLSILGSRHYGNQMALAKRADRLQSLLSVHRITLHKENMNAALQALNDELGVLLETRTVIFLPDLMDKTKIVAATAHDEQNFNDADIKALQLSWDGSKPAGAGSNFVPAGCNWRFEPLITTEDEIGVLAIESQYAISDGNEHRRLLSGIADQVALILERLQLGHVAEKTKIQAEREKLRSMLLSSVSHDLKTPLASVIGSLSVYNSMGDKLPEDQRGILIHTALEEAQRLDSFITNILDMTRIESGQIELKQEWVQPETVISDVQKRLKTRLASHPLEIIAPDEPVEVQMDVVMTGQVLQNLLDNAAKYTPPLTRIEVEWHAREDGLFSLHVRDFGQGIPEENLQTIFDKYTRIKKQDTQVAGTGLGLAIAKAVMQAQDGDIAVRNHTAGGAEFTLTLPQTRKSTKKEEAA